MFTERPRSCNIQLNDHVGRDIPSAKSVVPAVRITTAANIGIGLLASAEGGATHLQVLNLGRV